MNEFEILRTLLSEQIKRNADLHVMIANTAEDLKEARRERDALWDERDELRKKLYDSDAVMKWSASKVEELNKGLIRLVKERDEVLEELKVWRQLNVLIAKLKEEAK